MKKEKDARYHKTRKKIIQAMTTLLKQKNFAKITVKDICEEAKISRAGFYLHFEDKYDLVTHYQTELVAKVNELLLNNQDPLPKKETIIFYILNYLKTDGQLLALLISKNGSIEIQEQIKKMIRLNALNNTIPHVSIKLTSDIEKKYFVIFYSNALFGVIQEWINNGQKETPEQLMKIINTIIPFELL